LANPSAGGIYNGNEFNHLIATSSRTVVGLQGKSPPTEDEWIAFRNARLGTSNVGAKIDVNVRDQTNTPPLDLFNIETATAADVAKILTNNALTTKEKDKLLIQLRDNFRGMPESYSRLVSHGMQEVEHNNKKESATVYHYFPQLTIDLTGSLNSVAPLDRFDFLAAAIRIPAESKIRFINFSPKAADLFDFTLGQLKQTASVSANATAADKSTMSNSVVSGKTGGPQTTVGGGGEMNLGGAVTFAASDELTRDLKSSLEARSAGILDGGHLLLIELRGNDQKRIGGTYTFNVMLEVPSTVEKKEAPPQAIWTSNPVETNLVGEVRVVGIVRHVVKPGQTGTFKRVPEPLNDETFREVVLRDMAVPLLTFNNLALAQITEATTLVVYTNHESASFTIYDETTNEVLGHGTGREAHFAIGTPNKVKVLFHPIILSGNSPQMLSAPMVANLSITKTATAVGSYTTKTTGDQHGSKQKQE
jgi:hypothetical protein